MSNSVNDSDASHCPECVTPLILRLVGHNAADFLIERIVGGLIGFAAAFVLTLLVGTVFVKTPTDYRQFK